MGQGLMKYKLRDHLFMLVEHAAMRDKKTSSVYSTIISTPEFARSSSLPRDWCPFWRRKPDPRSGAGPRGCLTGRRSWDWLSNPTPIERLLPIGPAEVEDWLLSCCSQENIPRSLRGLPEVGPPMPVPRDSPPKLFTSRFSSRCMLKEDPDGVGVRVGVFEAPLVAPSNCC